MDITVIDVIKQMSYVIPSIIVATCTLTAAIHGVFKIEKPKVNHLISWIVAVCCALAFVGFNGLTFGLGGWDYAVAAICGLITGAAANGIYDWEKIKAIFDFITKLFSGELDKKADAEDNVDACQENTCNDALVEDLTTDMQVDETSIDCAKAVEAATEVEQPAAPVKVRKPRKKKSTDLPKE